MNSGPSRSRLRPDRADELFATVLALLREVGYEALTVDAVAARARTSKATLYRRWPGKPQLVVAALRHHKPLSLQDIDTGSLRADLVESARRIGAVAVEDSALMAAMAHAAHTSDELAQVQRDVLMQPETDAINGMLDRAVDRGEVAADNPALAYCPQLFVSAVLARPLLEGEYAGVDYLVRYVDAVVLPSLGFPQHHSEQHHSEPGGNAP